MIRKIILIIVLLIIAIIVYFYVTDWRYRQFDPQINPHPKYFMTIKGKVAPSLAGKVPVRFVLQYDTMNEACYETTNALEGASGPRIKNFTYVGNTKSKPGDFKLKIPLDYYLPGKCDWRVSSISFSVGADDALSGLSGFALGAKIKATNAALSFVCENNACKQVGSDWFSNTSTLPIEKKYKLLLRLEE